MVNAEMVRHLAHLALRLSVCYIRCAECVCVCAFPADSGTSGEGRGLRANSETRESPHLPPRTAAAENSGPAERRANR